MLQALKGVYKKMGGTPRRRRPVRQRGSRRSRRRITVKIGRAR